MRDLLTERLNQILPKITSEDFLTGGGIGNEIAFYIFDCTSSARMVYFGFQVKRQLEPVLIGLV